MKKKLLSIEVNDPGIIKDFDVLKDFESLKKN